MQNSSRIDVRKQLISYILFGVCATGTDYVLYNCLIYLDVFNYNLSKTLSFFAGTLVSYFLNKYFTFKVTKKSYREMVLFFILYLISMGFNVVVNMLSLNVCKGFLSLHYSITLAFLVATAGSMIINFLGQKFWIFAVKQHYERAI